MESVERAGVYENVMGRIGLHQAVLGNKNQRTKSGEILKRGRAYLYIRRHDIHDMYVMST